MMKQLLLVSLACVLFAFQGISQTVYTDDFESYTSGQGIADQDATGTWTTWSDSPGSAEDPLVTDAAANGGSQSMVVASGNDGVLLLNDLTTNRYRVEFYLMVPVDYVGYYNILQDFAGASSTWGMQVFFQDGVGTIDGNGAAAATFNYTPGEWMKIQHFVDLDNDWIDFYIDGEIIHAYQWSNGTFNDGSGINKLDAFNFYAWDDGGSESPTFYMDDYIIEQVAIPNPPASFSLQVENDTNVNISWSEPADGTPQSYSVIRDGEEIAVVTGTTYLDTHLYPGDYDYQVKAYYGESVGYSASPGVETATIQGGTPRNLVVYEIFTGTWCPYCPTAAEAIDMMADEGLDVAIIEYHGGDDYETPATGTRTNYLIPFFDDGDNSFGYPTTVINGMFGSEGAMPSAAEQNELYDYYYDEYKPIPSIYTITPAVELVSTDPVVLDVDVDVEETLDYYGQDEMRLQVALTETSIPESWQGGLDEVNFVLRDMLPNANGTVLDFSSSASISESFQLSLDASWVTENCELVFFVENRNTAGIMDAVKYDLSNLSSLEANTSIKTSVYPNPAQKDVNVAASERIDHLRLYSITGQLVMEASPNKKQERFSVKHLPAGIYSLHVGTENGTKVEKVVVE
ncbi:MAG TPA: T9SS type A sorting domain-containing protein [Bacteroidales bacterium]|nr:T9SS type A sorting domain-containing protein [Bacteroidales bacterium]